MEMHSAKELLVFEPRIHSDLEKYIWISDSFKVHREAQRFFVCMLKKGIYIKGFATDKESMFNLKMYNKKIYDINKLDKERSIVFYDTYLERFDVELPEEVHNARVLNPELPQENIVIWGSGITGKRVFKVLSEEGKKIECYIDSNKDLEGTYKCGLPVHTPEYLEKFANPPIIIEAMESWEELDAYIRGEYKKRFFFSFVENDAGRAVYSGRYISEMFNLMTWNINFAFFVGKKVYIYGIGEVEGELAEYFKLLDIKFGGFLIDESDIPDEGTHSNYNVYYVEDILYEKDFFVWVYDKSRVKRLEELGLVSHENYIYYHGANNTSAKRKNILDTNLGNTYLAGGRYPGITIYGDDKEKDFRIMVLGGSTTDGKFYSFKSWPELMYEELNNNGLENNITVYNGGVCGYASGQELLKLIRDAIPLKPNMIIVYDGLNDLSMGFSYPLTNGYIKKIFEFAKENIENDEDESLFMGEISICQGVEAKKDMFEAWLSNIRAMNAIAREWNISFYSFCSPMLGSKKGKTEIEKNMLLSVYSPMITNLMNGSFRKRINQMGELPVYIHDLSHIFDHEKDVYMDQSHVYEKGNRIIAREITRIILPELSCV